MTFFLDAAFKNARRLNLPKRHIGVSWSDIVDFCDDYLNAGESEENINKKLTKAIVALQNATFDKKNLREGLSDGEKSHFFAGGKRIKGDRGFFEASTFRKENQVKESEWKQVYDLLNSKNDASDQEGDFFYANNALSNLDKFASFVINRIST